MHTIVPYSAHVCTIRWGENLQAVRDFPASPTNAVAKVVYSPHAYGPGVFNQPYFGSKDFPGNLIPIWHKQWGYLAAGGIAPVLIGEWGGTNGGQDHDWQVAMANYLREHEIGSFYWCAMCLTGVNTPAVLWSSQHIHCRFLTFAQVLEP